MLQIRVKPPGTAPVVVYDHEGGPFDVGRAPASEPVPRCVVADDPWVSRNHVRLEEAGRGRVRVTNLSRGEPILADAGSIAPGASRVLGLPITFQIGHSRVDVEDSGAGRSVLQTLAAIPSSPLLRPRKAPRPDESTHDPAVVAGWFETLIAVQRAPAGSPEFFAQTARALVEQVGMDVGLVLVRRQGGWQVVARFADPHSDERLGFGPEFSGTVLDLLLREKRTVSQVDDLPPTASLAQVTALVASPVISPEGEVTGALYGARRSPLTRSLAITPLEAQMVQVLATAVGVGLARAAAEEEMASRLAQYRQQFNDQLVQALAADGAGLLAEQDREVTLLFADIRGFSRLSESLGPADTFRLVSEVMEALTETVKRHEGVVMDYVGDELIALWNAPLDNPRHARLAVNCAAGLNLALAPVDAAWAPRVGGHVAVGVGVNTGPARVGNTGTKYKRKYGALGHTVNIASRAQGATRMFRCPVLLTGSTRAGLPPDAPVRRVGRVRVAGIDTPVELFQLLCSPEPIPPEILSGYDEALRHFEAWDLAAAAAALDPLVSSAGGQADGATSQLAQRVAQLIRAGGVQYEAVMELVAK